MGNNINDFSRTWSTHRSCPVGFLKGLKLSVHTFTSSIYGRGLSFHLKAGRWQASHWFWPHLPDSGDLHHQDEGTDSQCTWDANPCYLGIFSSPVTSFPTSSLFLWEVPRRSLHNVHTQQWCDRMIHTCMDSSTCSDGSSPQVHQEPGTRDQRFCFYTK